MQRNAFNEFAIADRIISAGETVDVTLKISESYAGAPIHLPLRVVRGAEPGPALFVAGAVHGDELNGAGIVRALIVDDPPLIQRGTLVLVPVVNVMGFENHSRYMPDRRDLNRYFLGSPAGSLTARLAHAFFHEIVRQCDVGIDLHTAANFRTNIPNIRADMSDVKVSEIARAFGCELIINSPGPRSSLRLIATQTGCATIVVEAGEPWKIQRKIVRFGVRGVRNVLIAMNMMDGELIKPQQQAISHRTVWTRASEAGLLCFHVSPGDYVEIGQPIATNSSLLGTRSTVMRSRASGMVMGMTTLPSVKPGDPVCHVALLDEVVES